jgi:molecular chaperone DnaK
VFLTAQDNQTRVTVRVAQGESSRFRENTYLGEVELSGIRGAARGDVRIAVTFELDADGILNVRAREEGTKREATATLKLFGTNTDAEEMEQMMARQRERQVVG